MDPRRAQGLVKALRLSSLPSSMSLSIESIPHVGECVCLMGTLLLPFWAALSRPIHHTSLHDTTTGVEKVSTLFNDNNCGEGPLV